MALAGRQFHSASCPISAKSPRTLPIPRESSAATFSRIAKRGRTRRMDRTNSRQSPERSPCNPAPKPARLISWHGNPPQMTSASPSWNSLVVMSSWHGTAGQCFASTSRQNGSISQKPTVCIPARSSPREKPPMPLKRSRTFIVEPNLWTAGVRAIARRSQRARAAAAAAGHPIP